MPAGWMTSAKGRREAARHIQQAQHTGLRSACAWARPAVETLVQPAEAVREVRRAIRAGIGDVWTTVPESMEGFTPHVSVAYSNADGPAEPIRRALAAAQAEPVTCTVTHAELITLGRDEQMYTWKTVTRAALG